MIVALFFAWGLSSPSVGQDWHTYTDARRVSGLDVVGDTLWAGTDGGLLTWDLPAHYYIKRTATEGLADQLVREVLVASDGTVWIGTVCGVQAYDGASWSTFTTANSPLPDDTVYALAEDQDGALWFGTGFGCARYDGGTWSVFTDLGGGATQVAVRGIAVDSQNRVWTANNPDNYGEPGGVSMYDGETWTRLDPDPGGIGQYFLCLAIDGEDRVWAGSWTNWVFAYDGAWTHYTSANSELVGQQIEAIHGDPAGTVWIANHAPSAGPTTGGLAHYAAGSWTAYLPTGCDLPDPTVYALASSGGVLYAGTAQHGTVAFDGVAWVTYATSNEPACNWITAVGDGPVGAGGDGIWFGTDHAGVLFFDGLTWGAYNSGTSGLGDDYVNDVLVQDATLWVGSRYSGLWVFDGAAWTQHDTGSGALLGDEVVSVARDSEGTLWLGTSGWEGPLGQDGALTRFDGTIWTHYTLESSGLIDDDNLQVTVGPDDVVWIGTEEGVSRFDGINDWQSYDTGSSGLIEDHVEAIACAPDGAIWFATRGGVSRLVGESWTSFTTADGLPSNRAADIVALPSGVVWVVTDGGAAAYTPTRGWEAFTQGGGLGDDDLLALGGDGTGALWFGSERSGISRYDPEAATVAPDLLVAPNWWAAPNPFRTDVQIVARHGGREPSSAAIYDAAGRLVRVLRPSAGPHGAALVWDGRDRAGRIVPAGIYTCRPQATGAGGALRLVRIR